MCQFKSMVITKNKDVLYLYDSESHEDILDYYKDKYDLLDNTCDPAKLKFARIEIVPPDNDVFEKNLKKWQFKLDQSIKPKWFTKNCEKKCFDELEKYLNDVIIDGVELKKISRREGLYIKNSKIGIIENSQVNVMEENSQVNEMRENSQVNVMWGNSQVNVMWGNSRVNEMEENSQVNVMWGNSQVNVMWGNSQVNMMEENSRVNEMRENSRVNVMWGNSRVNEMRENSRVNEMEENSRVNEMRGNSQVKIYSQNSKYNLNDQAIVIDQSSNKKIILCKDKNIKIKYI